MRINKFVAIFLIAGIAIGCNENRIYEMHKSEFPNYRWEKARHVEFSPQIVDKEQKYQVYIAIRHVYGFQLKSVKVKVNLISPSGESISKKYTLKVFKSSNEYLSDCAGDYCDLEVLVEDDFTFKEAGKYSYTIAYDMDADYIPNVMQVGLIIDKKVEGTK